jgi:hypothetical protein
MPFWRAPAARFMPPVEGSLLPAGADPFLTSVQRGPQGWRRATDELSVQREAKITAMMRLAATMTPLTLIALAARGDQRLVGDLTACASRASGSALRP